MISKTLKKVFVACFLGATTLTMAQDLKQPTLNDLIPGGQTYRFAENKYGLQWWGDRCIQPETDEVKVVDPKNGKELSLFTRKALNEALQNAGLKPVSHLYSVRFPWADKTEILLPQGRDFAVFNWETNELTVRKDLPKEMENVDYHAESGNVAYTVKNNLYVNGVQVTNEPEGVVCGTTVHRNEFGISKGTYWSPKGTLLAFYRMDESMVTQYPLVDITARVGEVNYVRYPMAGMTSHQVTVGVYNPATRQTIYLKAGDPTNRYFTNISWSPDEKMVYLIELNRDQNHSKLCQYSAETGELLQVLIEEKHPKYVEPQHPILFLPWNENKFIYQSQWDGFNHLYVCDLKDTRKSMIPLGTEEKVAKEGTLKSNLAINQLTKGNWLVQSIVGFNEAKKEVIITSTEISPMQSNLYKVSLKNGKRTPLDAGTGVHYPLLSASGKYLLDNYQDPVTPRNIDIVATQNQKRIHLLKAANPFEGLVMPSIEMGTMKAADGVTDLYYRILKPADFNPNKKYPAIIYVYGGPHAQMLCNSYNYDARGWDLYMANRGYIMMTIDNRGSSNRGLEFENCTFRHLGVKEGQDQVLAAKYLQSLPYVDANRIGVHGWSFGGHMTVSLLLRYPDLFKVGVAGGPVIDWSYYEIMYGERYMDTPQTNPEGYKETNLKNIAGNLKGKLLIIHDDHDDTCVPQHSLSFLKACVEANTYPDFFVYPCHKHNVIGYQRVHLHEKITRYFEDNL